MSEDDRWPDPDESIADRRRLAVRLGCALIAFVVIVALSRDFLDAALVHLWPPTDPLARWVTLVFLYLFGYVLVPLSIGSFVADVLLERI